MASSCLATPVADRKIVRRTLSCSSLSMQSTRCVPSIIPSHFSPASRRKSLSLSLLRKIDSTSASMTTRQTDETRRLFYSCCTAISIKCSFPRSRYRSRFRECFPQSVLPRRASTWILADLSIPYRCPCRGQNKQTPYVRRQRRETTREATRLSVSGF